MNRAYGAGMRTNMGASGGKSVAKTDAGKFREFSLAGKEKQYAFDFPQRGRVQYRAVFPRPCIYIIYVNTIF